MTDPTRLLCLALHPVDHGVAGVAWNDGALAALDPLQPPWVRTDARLGGISPSAESDLQFDALLGRVSEIRAAGGEPVLILAYAPDWMGEARAQGCEVQFVGGTCAPSRVRPDDLDVWEDFIFEAVHTVATAPDAATHFEVWNEPDVAAVFWHDTPEAFLELAIRTHRAVQRVEEETGIDLQIGGPTVAEEYVGLFDAVTLEAYVEVISGAGLPLDFVSWHHYANSPLLGPDGNEGFLPDDVYDAISGTNPETSPAIYGELTREFRTRTSAALPAGAELPELIITEWNLSGGGFDLRHGTHEGAAFVLGSLIEMERAGLDRAMMFRAVGGDNPGDWGLVQEDGSRKPTWQAVQTWLGLDGDVLDLRGDAPEDGVWARASRSGDGVDVLLANFRAVDGEPVAVSLGLEGACAPTPGCMGFLDAESDTLDASRPIRAEDGRYRFALPAQSSARLRLTCPG